MISKKLSYLLEGTYHLLSNQDCDVTGLSLDSRKISPGDLFFACQGVHLDGRQFMNDAISKGARVILCEDDSSSSLVFSENTLIVPIKNLNHSIGKIAANFYDNPAKLLRIVGVTGTNGKTSCTHFLGSAFQHLNMRCGVIGTLGVGLYGHIEPGTLTTPDAITLQKTFNEFVKENISIVAMEVSSHSIDQGRVNAIPFEIGIFTNLTRDHLDYHGDMETYGAVKKRLFDNTLLKYAVINADDEFGLSLIRSLKKGDVLAYSVQPKKAKVSVPLIFAENVRLSADGIRAQIYSPWGEGVLNGKLMGQFNLSNALAVLGTLCLMKIPFDVALEALSFLTPVSGRMETLGGGQFPTVVIDYAHTPDALQKVLMALRNHCSGKLYCLFGCGGDRDKGKRPIMGQIAKSHADEVVITDDNPRTENPISIVNDILKGFSNMQAVTIQHDRSKAIQYIIQCAKPGDYVLIAGKGAELFQQIGDKKIPFSDIQVAKECLRRI